MKVAANGQYSETLVGIHLHEFECKRSQNSSEHIHPGGEFMRRMKEAAESSVASASGDYVDLSHVIGNR